MSTPGLSEEACKAVNAGFDAMSTWRIETAKYGREKQRASAREDGCSCSGVGMAGGNRRGLPRANAEHHQNADPNNGSNNGRLGGADKITAPDDRLPIGDVVEAKVLAQLRPSWQLAKRRCFPNGDGEPLPALDTNGRAVAESVDRRDVVLGQGR